MTKARAAFVGGRYMDGDREDAYISLCFRDQSGESDALDAHEAEFIQLCTSLLTTDPTRPPTLGLPDLT
jgi:hypothetical protein